MMPLWFCLRAYEALGSHAAEERDAAGLVAALEAKTTDYFNAQGSEFAVLLYALA